MFSGSAGKQHGIIPVLFQHLAPGLQPTSGAPIGLQGRPTSGDLQAGLG